MSLTIPELKKLFDKFDDDGSGELSLDEVPLLLKEVGIMGLKSEQIMLVADENGDGKLSFDEFLQLVGETNNASNDAQFKENLKNRVDQLIQYKYAKKMRYKSNLDICENGIISSHPATNGFVAVHTINGHKYILDGGDHNHPNVSMSKKTQKDQSEAKGKDIQYGYESGQGNGRNNKYGKIIFEGKWQSNVVNNLEPEKIHCKKTFGNNKDDYKKQCKHYVNNLHEPPKPYIHNAEFNWNINDQSKNDYFYDSLDKIKDEFVIQNETVKKKQSKKRLNNKQQLNLSVNDIEGTRPKSRPKYIKKDLNTDFNSQGEIGNSVINKMSNLSYEMPTKKQFNNQNNLSTQINDCIIKNQQIEPAKHMYYNRKLQPDLKQKHHTNLI